MDHGSVHSDVLLAMLSRPALGRVEAVATSPVGELVRSAGTVVALADGSEAWVNVDGTAGGWICLSRDGWEEIETWEPAEAASSYDFAIDPDEWEELLMVINLKTSLVAHIRIDGSSSPAGAALRIVGAETPSLMTWNLCEFWTGLGGSTGGPCVAQFRRPRISGELWTAGVVADRWFQGFIAAPTSSVGLAVAAPFTVGETRVTLHGKRAAS
jgi:hypothetical protein